MYFPQMPVNTLLTAFAFFDVSIRRSIKQFFVVQSLSELIYPVHREFQLREFGALALIHQISLKRVGGKNTRRLAAMPGSFFVSWSRSRGQRL